MVEIFFDDEAHSSERINCKKERDCEELGIKPPLFICAPMVRYSKVAFRKLVRSYGCDLAYTPMIYASCFVASEKCRYVELTAEEAVDRPIAQFAANRPEDFANAAELIYGRCGGIDLNCGCPKRDVRKCGCGSKLLEEPELIADIVRQTRARISDLGFSVSVKIRIDADHKRIVELCRQVESAGVSHIAVHARTVGMRDHEPPHWDAVRLIKSVVAVPVYANGGCKSYADALEIACLTGADGVMAANGLLANPALFAGYAKTPRQCVKDWLSLEQSMNIPMEAFHHHLNFMLKSTLPKWQRILLNDLKVRSDVRGFIESEIL